MIRDKSEFQKNKENLILSLLLIVCGAFSQGAFSLLQLLIAILCAITCELILKKIFSVDIRLKDLNAICIGAMCALFLPSTCPLFVSALMGVFSVMLVSIPFGGPNKSAFSPAAVAAALMSLLFSGIFLTYPDRASQHIFASSDSFSSLDSIFDILNSNQLIVFNKANILKLLSGEFGFAVGTCSILLLLAVFIYRIIKNKKSAILPCAFSLTLFLLSIIFSKNEHRLEFAALNLICEFTLLVCALFLTNDKWLSFGPVALITTGVLGAAFCFALRAYANVCPASIFALLLMEGFVFIFKKEKEEAVEK